MKHLTKFIIIFLLLWVVKNPAFAYDLTVTCGAASCDKDKNTPLFDSSIVWYPLLSVGKEIHVINNRTYGVTLETNATGTTTNGALDEVMDLTIAQTGIFPPVWTGTLKEFYNQPSITLPGINGGGGTLDLTFTLSMDDVGNDYQNTNSTFDLNFNFQGDDEPTPTPTTVQTSTNGGGGGGGAPSTSTGGGGGGTTNTISAPPLITQLITALPRFFIPVVPAVAGAETTVYPTQKPEKPQEGEVSGATTCQTCIWWPILVLQALALLFHSLLTKVKKKKLYWPNGIFISIVSYIIFLLVNRSCRTGWQLWVSSSNIWCTIFFFLVIIVFGAILYPLRPKNQTSSDS